MTHCQTGYTKSSSCLSEEKTNAEIRFKMYQQPVLPSGPMCNSTKILCKEFTTKEREEPAPQTFRMLLSGIALIWLLCRSPSYGYLKVPLLPTGNCSYSDNDSTIVNRKSCTFVYLPARIHTYDTTQGGKITTSAAFIEHAQKHSGSSGIRRTRHITYMLSS